MRRIEHTQNHDEQISGIVLGVMRGKVQYDKSNPVRVLPHPDKEKEGCIVDAGSYEGTIEVTSSVLPGRYRVRCLHINSRGQERQEYFNQDDVTLRDLGNVVGAAWEAGYERTGHSHESDTHTPHKPYSKNRSRTGRDRRAPDDRSE